MECCFEVIYLYVCIGCRDCNYLWYCYFFLLCLFCFVLRFELVLSFCSPFSMWNVILIWCICMLVVDVGIVTICLIIIMCMLCFVLFCVCLFLFIFCCLPPHSVCRHTVTRWTTKLMANAYTCLCVWYFLILFYFLFFLLLDSPNVFDFWMSFIVHQRVGGLCHHTGSPPIFFFLIATQLAHQLHQERTQVEVQ